MREGSRPWWPYFLLTLPPLFWALNVVVARAMRNDIPPVAMCFWRWIIAGIIVVPLAATGLRSKWPAIRGAWKPLAALGLIGVTLFNTISYAALRHTTATNAALLNSTIPVFILLLSWIALHERAPRRQALGVGISLIGVIAILAQGELSTLTGLSFNRGDLWLLGAMLLWSVYTLLLRWKPTELSPLELLACIILSGLPVLGVAYALELASGQSFEVRPATAAALAYYGIFPSVFAYLCFNRGVALLGHTKAGIFIHLVPVFGVILSAVLIGELPHVYHIAGMALVFGGIWLSSTARPQLPAIASEP